MAIGGALRSAIKLGRFSVAARESRRQARVLQSAFPDGARGLDPELGRMLPLEERGFERMMGQGYGGTARNNAIVVDPASGRRIVVNQNFDDFMEGLPAGGRGPIEAPYEGMRTWPMDDGLPGLEGFRTPSWMGRGPGPNFQFHSNVGPQGLSMPSGAGFNTEIPRVFGGNRRLGTQSPSPSLSQMESMTPQELIEFMNPNAFEPRPRFFFDDFNSGSPTAGLMGRVDPETYLGFRTVRGFPFD